MTVCPRCHLKFRSVIYCKVVKRGWANHWTWQEVLECGHHRSFPTPTDGLGLAWAYRRACKVCLLEHHKALGLA